MRGTARGKARVLAWAFLIPLFYLPILSILGRVALEPAGRQALRDLLVSQELRRTLSFTLWESLLSAAGSILIALPGAYFFGRHSFRGRRILRGLLILPFVLPSILGILAMVVAYGRNGYLNGFLLSLFGPEAPQFTGLYGLAGIVLTHIFFNFALGIRMIGEAWERLEPNLLAVAESLGAKPFRAWRSVIFPLLWPAVAAAFVLAFAYSSLSFTVVLVFGGLRFRTFEVLIYTRLNEDLNFLGAYAVAAVQMLLTGGILWLRATMARHRRRVGSAFGLPSAVPLPAGWPRPAFTLYGLVLFFFFLGPPFGLLLRAWHERGAPDGALTWANFAALASTGFRTGVGQAFWPVLLNSLALAFLVGLSVAALAYLLVILRGESGGGLLDVAIELPLGASLVTFCFGLLTLYGHLFPPPFLVGLAQTVMGLPLAYLVIRDARSEQRAVLVQAARSLGAGWWRAKLDVELPLLRRALLTAFAYGAAFSLGDVAGVLVIGQGRVVTIATAVYRLMGHYRFPLALALGTVLLLFSLGLFMLLDRAGEYRGASGGR